MRASLLLIVVLMTVTCCKPVDPVVLRAVEDVQLKNGNGLDPVLLANARFYNPNKWRLRLKEVQIDIFIDEKKTARIDQQLKSVIKAKSEFTIPLEVQLSLKEMGLVDSILSLLGGKKYKLQYLGHIRVLVRGVPVNIPVDHSQSIGLR